VAEAGIDYRVRRGRGHDARADGPPAIRLAYQRPVAVPPPCDQWTEDVGRNEARIPYPNWGCATQRNLALMVDNARDLQQPQEEDPRSSERRSVTWSSYVGSGSSSGGDSGGDTPKKAPASAVKK
jgi:pilus assembly protein CpaD